MNQSDEIMTLCKKNRIYEFYQLYLNFIFEMGGNVGTSQWTQTHLNEMQPLFIIAQSVLLNQNFISICPLHFLSF